MKSVSKNICYSWRLNQYMKFIENKYPYLLYLWDFLLPGMTVELNNAIIKSPNIISQYHNQVQMRKCLWKHFISEMVSTIGRPFSSIDRLFIDSTESWFHWGKNPNFSIGL